jgi:hypothetical protein
MDRRERVYDPEETLRAALDAFASELFCGMPGIVQKVKDNGMTVDVQPARKARIRNWDGTYQWVKLPVCQDCPVVIVGGGGVSFTAPIQKGDECFLAIADACIDQWWQLGGVQVPLDIRAHDLSDGFAIVGLRSKPRFFNASPTTARITTDDGTCYMELDPAAKKVNIVAPGGFTVNGMTVDSSGNVISPATITGKTQVVAGTGGTAVHLTTHGHPALNTAPTAGS